MACRAILISLMMIPLLGAASCQKIPPFEADLYLPDFESQSLIGPEEDIPYDSDRMDNFIAMEIDDFAEQCIRIRFRAKEWKSGTKLIDAWDFTIPGFEDLIEEEIAEATQ